MAKYENLPIFKQMLDLTVHIEKTVRYFPVTLNIFWAVSCVVLVSVIMARG